jgi:hypothetical protein
MDQWQRNIGQQLDFKRVVFSTVHAPAMNAVPPPLARVSLA